MEMQGLIDINIVIFAGLVYYQRKEVASDDCIGNQTAYVVEVAPNSKWQCQVDLLRNVASYPKLRHEVCN